MEILFEEKRSFFFRHRYYLVALVVIFIDQLVKLIVRFTLDPSDPVHVFGDWFKIEYVYNKGAAFGLTLPDIFATVGIEMSPETGKRLLTLFSIGAVIIIIYFLKEAAKQNSPLPFFVALILGGALGNIIDRVFYGVWFQYMINDPECMGLMHGCVVDMFYFDIWQGEIFGIHMALWPVFNIADMSISIGIVTIFVFQRRFFRKHKETAEG